MSRLILARELRGSMLARGLGRRYRARPGLNACPRGAWESSRAAGSQCSPASCAGSSSTAGFDVLREVRGSMLARWLRQSSSGVWARPSVNLGIKADNSREAPPLAPRKQHQSITAGAVRC